MLDISQNAKMNLNDVREIQQILVANKKEYDEERFREFMERKHLRKEEDISKIIQLKQEAKMMIKEGIDKRIEAKEMQMDEDCKKKVIYSLKLNFFIFFRIFSLGDDEMVFSLKMMKLEDKKRS